MHSIKIIFLSFCLLWSAACFAAIKVGIERQPEGLNESFRIFFESDEILNNINPDFSPLNTDFQILSQAYSVNRSFVNGRMESSSKWILEVVALRQGKLNIPEITFGHVKSPLRVLTLTPNHQSTNTSAEDVFLQAEVIPKQAYVQQQLLLTIRLLSTLQLNGDISEPQLSGVDAVIKRMGGDKRYQTQQGNRTYFVYERRYAIFPQASGNITIEPIIFQGHSGGNRNILNLFNRSGSPIIKRTQAITQNVQPPPAHYQGDVWLPTQDITLQAHWLIAESTAQPVFRVGQPITRAVTLKANGLIASQLPELTMGIGDNFKLYPDKPALDDKLAYSGISSSRVEKIAIIPKAEGEYWLPEIVVPWWDTKTNQQKFAKLPTQMIQVLPAASLIDSLKVDTSKQQSMTVDDTGQSLNENLVDSSMAYPALTIWRALSVFLALLWLLTLGLYLRLYFKQAYFAKLERQSRQKKKQSLRAVTALLKRACKENNLNAAKDALLQWHNHDHTDNPVTNLGEISQYYDNNLAQQIDILNQLLYSGIKQLWDGQALWACIEERTKQVVDSEQGQLPTLQPLHRL